jgi:hypothetical protein
MKQGVFRIPEGVKTLNSFSMDGCAHLSGIILPESLKRIEGWVFSECRSLKTLHLPKGLTLLVPYAFIHCMMLESITVAEGNIQYVAKDGILYTKSLRQLIHCPVSKVGEVQLPDGLTTIPEASFIGRKEITKIIFPKSLRSIKRIAFVECAKLTRLEFPKRNWEYSFCSMCQPRTGYFP